MALARNKLTARAVQTLDKPGRHGDGNGLYLSISGDGRRRWVFLFRWQGKLKEKGLGGTADVTLAQARDRAEDCRALIRKGLNPITAAIEPKQVPTFGEFADEVVASLEGQWRNEKHRAQWKSTLSDSYCASLRKLSLDAVDTEAVLKVLKPLWQKLPETASRLRGRIEKVLDAAKAKGYRSGENPARWRGHLDSLLPKRQRLTRGHHKAMGFTEVPGLLTKLRSAPSVSALALEFAILTAARSGEVMGARWSEIDREKRIWTVPATRMKAGREHRVPLTNRALSILEEMAKLGTDPKGFVFPGRAKGKGLSVMALAMLLRQRAPDVTVHGFRSAFRDWVGEETHFPRELAEAALAHLVGDQVERAYRRGDALEKRRELMDAWARYCEPKSSENVVPLRKRKD